MRKEFEKYLESLGVSENTIRNYLSDIRLAEKRGIISPLLTEIDMDKLFEAKVSAGSKRRTRASIRKYAKFLVKEGLIESVPIIIDNYELPKSENKLPNVASIEEMKKIIENAPSSKIKLILKILTLTGCRISSLAKLRVEDITPEKITFKFAKGNKPYISVGTQEIFDSVQKFVGDRTGLLFVKRNGEEVSANLVRGWLKKGLKDSYINPHSIRHGVASALIESGTDIVSISNFLNHSSIATTQKYIHLSPKYLKTQIEKSHPFL